jgi:hypothetical protein
MLERERGVERERERKSLDLTPSSPVRERERKRDGERGRERGRERLSKRERGRAM